MDIDLGKVQMVEHPSQQQATSSKSRRDIDAKMLEISDIEDLRERRYLWTARAFTVVFVISLCVNIILVLSIANMIPLDRVEPYMLSFQDKNEQIVNIDPIIDISDRNVITESYVRQYIIQRNTVTSDIENMSMLWGPDGPLRWMSSDVVYSDFVSQSEDALAQVREKGFTRDVEILSVNKLVNDIWQAEVETRDMVQGATEPVVSRWTILLRIGYFMNSRVKYSLRLKNPIGFTVREYSIKPSSK